MIISRTPSRVSLFGGGTDYLARYRVHGGAVLAAAIDKYCYLSCRHLPPFFEHRIRVVYSKIENCQTVDQIEHPAVRAVLRPSRCARHRDPPRRPACAERHGIQLGVHGGIASRRVWGCRE